MVESTKEKMNMGQEDRKYGLSQVSEITGIHPSSLATLILRYGFPLVNEDGLRRGERPAYGFNEADIDKLQRFLGWEYMGYRAHEAIGLVHVQDSKSAERIIESSGAYMNNDTSEARESALQVILSLPTLTGEEQRVLRLSLSGSSIEECARELNLKSASDAKDILNQAHMKVGQAIMSRFMTS